MFRVPCTFHRGPKTRPVLSPRKPSRPTWDMLVAPRVRACLSAEGELLSWAPVIYSFSREALAAALSARRVLLSLSLQET